MKRSKEDLGDTGELCNYCDLTEFGDITLNTNSMNMCEGVNCDKAYENYLEEDEE